MPLNSKQKSLGIAVSQQSQKSTQDPENKPLSKPGATSSSSLCSSPGTDGPLTWFLPFLGLRRGGPDRQPGREARCQHADERIREPHLQIFRGLCHLNNSNNNNSNMTDYDISVKQSHSTMKKKKIDDKTGQVGEASYHFFQTKNCHVLKRKKAETKKFRPKFKLNKNIFVSAVVQMEQVKKWRSGSSSSNRKKENYSINQNKIKTLFLRLALNRS